MAGKIIEPAIYSFFYGALAYTVIYLIFKNQGFSFLVAGSVFFWQFEKRYFASIPDDDDKPDSTTPE